MLDAGSERPDAESERVETAGAWVDVEREQLDAES